MGLPQYSDHLLPRNSTALERVLSAAGARLTGLPIDIDKLKRPFDCPPQFLPHLGFELSVDVWENSWLEMRRRAAVAAAIPLQIKKGTAHTLREYVRYADGDVISITRPPQGVFAGKSLTREEREAWLASLPQIRIWSVRETSIAPLRKSFASANNTARMHNPRFSASWAYPVPSTALVRHQRRARWVVDGVETDTRVSNDGSTERLHLPSTAGLATFCNRPLQGYLCPSTSSRRLVTVMPTSPLPWRSAVTPSLQAVTAEPERVKVSGQRGYQQFCHMPLHAFLMPSTAPMRIFDRYAVYDGSLPPHRAATMFAGVGRLGWPAHYARAKVSVPGTRSRFAAGPGIFAPKTKYLVPHNPEPLAKVLRAARAAKRLSDRIDLVIGPDHHFVAGKLFIAGVDSAIVGYP